MKSSRLAVSPVVGNILLVAIVFVAASSFGFLVTSGNFNSDPNAEVSFEQTTECSETGPSCETVVRVDQMSNADYIIVAYNVPPGLRSSSYSVTHLGDSPDEIDDIPDNSTVQGAILVGPGDTFTLQSDPETNILVYVGLNGRENLMRTYTVRENIN